MTKTTNVTIHETVEGAFSAARGFVLLHHRAAHIHVAQDWGGKFWVVSDDKDTRRGDRCDYVGEVTPEEVGR